MKKNVVPLLFNNPEYPNYHNREVEYANFVSQYLMVRGMNFNENQNFKSSVAIAGIISLKISPKKRMVFLQNKNISFCSWISNG